MKPLHILFFSLLIIFSRPCHAAMDFDYLNKVYANATNKREIWTASKGYLQQLDLALKDTAKYNAIKQNKLQLLAKRLSRLRDHNARYKMLMQIVEEYRIVNFPKALAYIREAKKEAQLMNDKQAYFAAILKESRLFILKSATVAIKCQFGSYPSFCCLWLS